MTRRRTRESPRRYGDGDNLPLQGLTGIGIVATVSMTVAGLAFLVAVVVAWVF